jgi:hypothetical protein
MNKPLEPLSDRQTKMIVSNIAKVAKTGDTNYLTKQAYRFLNLSSGFIAHYNLFGFRAYYADQGDLATDILNNRPNNQWANFRPGEKDYEYYMAKRDCYNRICTALEMIGFKATRSHGWIY